MTECTQSSFEFQAHFSREVVARFDGGTMTSDAGAVLLRETVGGWVCCRAWQVALRTGVSRG